jgi:hypothetical protein
MTKGKIYPFPAIVLCLTVAFSFISLPVSEASADQPFMKAARADLNKALGNLRKATPDKGGHRARAIDLVQRAINRVNQGIAYDRRNDAELNAELDGTFPPTTPDQPFMQRAKDNLQDALGNLEKATADKGGHRADAMSLVRQAIEEVNRGISYDRRN